MREIKFRMWDFENNEMIPGNALAFEQYAPLVDLLNQKGIMQYTGLKDRAGNEIYEGDIVEYESIYGVKKIAEIVFQDAEFVPLGEVENNHSMSGWKDEQTNIVIGNVYNNPELLEG